MLVASCYPFAEYLTTVLPRRNHPLHVVSEKVSASDGSSSSRFVAVFFFFSSCSHLQDKRTTEAAETSDEEEEYQELPSSRASDADSDKSDADSESQDGVDGAKDAAVIDEGVSDLDYLKSRMKAGVGQRGNEDKTSSQTSSLTDTGQGVLEKSLPSAYALI